MREILFRGKQKEYPGEWIEGMFTIGKFAGKEYHAIERREKRIIACDYEWTMQPYEVIPETVGQYTGLTDKNGKKIFEGDIIAGAVTWQEQRKNGIVTFRDGSFGLIWYRGKVEQFTPFTSMCNVEYEVIGNIHDNPELLKGDKSDA